MMKKALLWGAAALALFVLMGCPEDQPDPPKSFTLTITGIPQELFVGASLVDTQDITKSIAVGTPSAGGTFTFYHSKALADGKWTYDSTKPFSKPGSYWIALAEVVLIDGIFEETAVYFYCEDGNKKAVSFPVKTPIAWGDFIKDEDE